MPVTAEFALEQLLLDSGISRNDIPGGLAARLARWRSRMSKARAIVLLDNALNADQVRPLLPMGPGCLVLITSRRRLVAIPEAVPLALDVMERPEALEMLHHSLGADHDHSPQALSAIAQACGYLPLAMTIALSRLRQDAHLSAAELAVDLQSQRAVVEHLSPEDAGVLSAFRVSMDRLSGNLRSGFLMLGLHPGPDFTVGSLAAMRDEEEGAVRTTLRELADIHLIERGASGRREPFYRMHDLVRSFAREEAWSTFTTVERVAALEGLREHYEACSLNEPARLLEERNNIPPFAKVVDDIPAAKVCLVAASVLKENGYYGHAEPVYRSVLAMQGIAQELEILGKAAWGLADTLRLTGDYAEAKSCYARSWQFFSDVNDTHGVAEAVWGFGECAYLTGDLVEARERYLEVHKIYEDTGDLLGKARALWAYATVLTYLNEDYETAIRHYREVRDVYLVAKSQRGYLDAVWGIADALRRQGKYEESRGSYYLALEGYEEVGDRRGQAEVLWGLGDLDRLSGEYASAEELFMRSQEINAELDNRRGVAKCLWGLGDTYRLKQDCASAADRLQSALRIHEEIGNRKGLALALESLGRLSFDRGDRPAGRKLLSAAQKIYDELEMSSAKRYLQNLQMQLEGESSSGPA